MFVDKAKIYVKAGDGGAGQVSYRREKYVEFGGPWGGDGGHGGDVIFRVDEGLRTLVDFKYQKHFKAQRGERGRTQAMRGADADDMIVRVPPGTVVIDDDTQEVIADLTRHDQEVVVAKGGKGGRGNMRFATPANPSPAIAENGEEGQERWVVLELKVLADVGLVGFPSVGKSTLISVVSAARPKIGAYHFTTLTPNLGVVDVGDNRSFVMADLPGLIEGAHEGVGLGHEFLRHVDRTRVILHVIDMAGTEGRDPYEDWLSINRELEMYSARLMERPQIIVANKMDMPDAETHLEMFRERLQEQYPERNYELFPISALAHQGVQQLVYRVADLLDAIPAEPVVEEVAETEERKVFRLERSRSGAGFTIRRVNDSFIVEGEELEKLVKRTQLTSHDAFVRFAKILRSMGVEQELRKKGAKDGHMVHIGDFEFEFVEQE